MSTDPQTDRPDVDDPRVLALAKARQQMAHNNPFNVVCPPWHGLTEQEQHLSLLDARNYLRAAINAGLTAAPAAVPPADRAGLRELIAGALSEARRPGLGGMTEADAVAYMAGAVMKVLPALVDRGAVLREATDELDAHAAQLADTSDGPAAFVAKARTRAATEWRVAAALLRRMADEPQRCGCGEPSTPGTVHRTDGPCYVDETPQPETQATAEPWLTDSARIGRTLIWSWADVGKGAFREGYRAAQAEARALLGGERGTDQQPETRDAPVYAIPLPGSNGISTCCGRPPCEFVGERVTRDPAKVTCPAPAVTLPGKEA